MDFHRLSRRELQTLCKRNKIPANITNVAMADALSDLPLVDGIDEFLNGEGSGVPESPMKHEFVDLEIPRTASRTSTRRKTVKDESITTRRRRAAAARCTEDSENRDLNVALTTPSLPSGRRKAAGVSSACKKVDFQMTVDAVEIEDNNLDQEKNVIEKTPAPKSQKRVTAASTRRRTETRNSGVTEQRVYSTRRSVRLLEKNMRSLGFGEDETIEPITVHMTFDEVPNSTGSVKEDTSLEIESKKTDESESNLDEVLELEIDNQEKNEQSEVQVSEVEPEIDLDSLNCSAANLITAKSDDSETEAPTNKLNVKCFPEVDEASIDDDAVKISAEEFEVSDEFSLPTEDVDLTVVHNSSIVDESSKEMEQNESICQSECVSEEDSEEIKLMNITSELSLPQEHVEEEIQVEELLKESICELEVEPSESICESKCLREEESVEEVELMNISTELSLPQEHVEEEIQVEEPLKESICELQVEPSESICESKCLSEEDSEEEVELLNISAELSLPHEDEEEEIQVDEPMIKSSELSLPREEDKTRIFNVLSSVEDSVMELKDDDLEFEEEEALDTDIDGVVEEIQVDELVIKSSELSLPHEQEKTRNVNVLSSVEDSVKEIKDDELEFEEKEALDADSEEKEALDEEETLDADIEGVDMKQLTISIQAEEEEEEEDTANSMDVPEKVSEELDDIVIQLKMEEALKDVNADAIDSLPEIPNDIEIEQKALVEVSGTTSTEETIPTSSNIDININGVQFEEKALATQFPRPAVETKSPRKDRNIQLLIDNSDAEEDEEQGKANCIERPIVENNDKSLRQLRKIFKEQLIISKKKKMDDNNTKVVGGGKVRTALQPLPENRIIDELEKRS